MAITAKHAAMIADAARREVARRLASGWVIADGVTAEDVTAQLAAHLGELRAVHKRHRVLGTALEPLAAWLTHAPFECLVNDLADVFAPAPTSNTAA